MKLSLQCPKCSNQIAVNQAELGRNISCPHCGNVTLSLVAPAAPPVINVARPTAGFPVKKLCFAVLGAVIFATACMALGAAAAAFTGRSHSQPQFPAPSMEIVVARDSQG